MELKKFDPPKYEDIKEKFFNGGILNDEEIATLFGLAEAMQHRLQAIYKLSKREG